MTVQFQLLIAYGNIMMQILQKKSKIETMQRTGQRKWLGLFQIAMTIMDD